MDVPWPAAGQMRVYDLAQPLHTGIPHHPNHPPYAFTLTKRHGDVVYEGEVSSAAELITTGGHVGTHVDGLAHVSCGGRLHGGVDVADHQSYGEGVRVHGIHEIAPFAAGGHLVDVPGLLGRALTPDDGVTAGMLEDWFAEHPAPGPGSVVCVRTGWDAYWSEPARFLGVGSGAPGVELSGARWLTERGILATGADTVAYERTPSPSLPVHVHLLVDSGVFIMEAMNLAGLASSRSYEFFFTATPLKIRGGTGSPIRPLAFVPAGPGDGPR
ncbi:MAG: cyclase family protein [Streptosporangiales bacterium]|nr:cyclase family protein [Streptosporangiales bacterium]